MPVTRPPPTGLPCSREYREQRSDYGPDRTATVIFKVKTHGIDDARDVPFYNCRANFILDRDGEWKRRTFQLFLPTVDPMRRDPIALPF